MGEIGHKSYVYNGNFAELIMYHSFLWFMYLIHLFFNMCFPGRRRIFGMNIFKSSSQHPIFNLLKSKILNHLTLSLAH